jgi:TRAP-type C4-dicarboxylate transport system substrate-binding protein
LAPEGTSLYQGLKSIKDVVMQSTGNCVEIKIFAGATAGDEKDVARKIQIGQLQGAALTGVGLGMIEPEIRVLELPFLFQTQSQVDFVYAQMRDYFNQKFEQKGFKLLGWAETGFVQIFSNKPITKRADLEGSKMWMWEGDPLAKAMYDALKVVPVPLAVTDVLTSLQTGLIDGCYAPPLGAIAFQWHTKTKHVTEVNLVNGTGGLIFSKKALDMMSPAQQKAVSDAVLAESSKLTSSARKDNQDSMAAVRSFGLTVHQLTPEAKADMAAVSSEVQAKLVGQLYPQSLLDKVLGLVKQAP